jgi:hypothetical protein
MIKKGDLVRHVSDLDFGLGIVTDVVRDATVPSVSIAKISWQRRPRDVVYPANLFTPDGLIVISEANSQDDIIINNENQTR